MESWRPVAILVDTKGQADFPRQRVVLTGPAEMEVLSGFLNFPSYATDISEVIQVQGWDEIEAVEIVPNYFVKVILSTSWVCSTCAIDWSVNPTCECWLSVWGTQNEAALFSSSGFTPNSGTLTNSISVKGVSLFCTNFNCSLFLDPCLACFLATHSCTFPLAVQECMFFLFEALPCLNIFFLC